MPNNEEFEKDILNPEEFETEDEDIEIESEPDGKDEQVDDQDDNPQTEDEPKEKAKTQEELDSEKQAEAKKNAYYAKLRRQREAEEKQKKENEIRAQAKLEAELEANKKNHYTNEPIIDEEDLKIYKIQKAIEENGGDPLADLPKALAEEKRKETKARKAEEEKKAASQNKLSNEAAALQKAYPEAIETVKTDFELLDLYNEKDGRWTLTECYEHLQATRKAQGITKAQVETDKKKKEIVEKVAKKSTSVPSSKTHGGKSSDEDVNTMSDEQFAKWYSATYHN